MVSAEKGTNQTPRNKRGHLSNDELA